MKIKSFFMWIFVFLLSFYAAAADNIVTYETTEIDSRLRTHLQIYLDPSQFLLVVSSKPDTTDVNKKTDPNESLPGLPGIGSKSGSTGAVSFIDSEGRVIMGSSSERNPVIVKLVFDESVPASQVKLFRDIIPSLGQLNLKEGDQLKVSIGKLGRTAQNIEKQDNIIESMVKYRRELLAIALGLLGSVALLLIINGLMAGFAKSRTPAAKNDRDKMDPRLNEPQQPPKSESAGDSSVRSPAHEAKKAEEAKALRFGRFGAGALNRAQLFSRDSLLYETTREVTEQAEKHPERIAHLLTHWIETGDHRHTACVTLLNNFDMKVTESILMKMVPSDIEQIHPHIGEQFDPFSEENAQVMIEARQDILKLTALDRRDNQRDDFQFLNAVDEDFLSQLLKTEPVENLALVATQIPGHRFSAALLSRSESEIQLFFKIFCEMKHIEEDVWKLVSRKLKAEYEILKGSTLSNKSKSMAVISLVNKIKDGNLQKQIMNQINNVSPDISARVRDAVILFEDLVHMNDRAARIFLLEAQIVTVLRAYHGLDAVVLDRVGQLLPKSKGEIFSIERKNGMMYSDEEAQTAQAELVAHAFKLVESGVIKFDDIKSGNKWGKPSPTIPKLKRVV